MAPVGRPPLGYEWREGRWVHAATGEPLSQETYRAELRRRQRELEKRRYWDEDTGTRARRRLRTLRDAAARAAAGAAARPRKPRQVTLVEQLRSDTPESNGSLMAIDNQREQ